MDIKLKEMFYKPIDRDIKGVIKVGQADDENIKQELEEYVVTRELNRHIELFFEAYKEGSFLLLHLKFYDAKKKDVLIDIFNILAVLAIEY